MAKGANVEDLGNSSISDDFKCKGPHQRPAAFDKLKRYGKNCPGADLMSPSAAA